MANQVYQIITDRILERVQKGDIPWQKPWKTAGYGPTNLVSKKEYRGINVWMLGHVAPNSPWFVTYNQAKSLGGQVKKGEKGWPVVFWKQNTYTKETEDGGEEERRGCILRYYTVFHVEQCEGLQGLVSATVEQQHDPIPECDKVRDRYFRHGPKLLHDGGGRAYYVPAYDSVHMPKFGQFNSAEEYYSTLFHEMTHSTGHKDRLNRKTLSEATYFGSQNYSKEELVAEMGASFLCGMTGIENKTVDNSVAYIQSWLKVLRRETKWLVEAASQAQKASDLILGVTPKA